MVQKKHKKRRHNKPKQPQQQVQAAQDEEPKELTRAEKREAKKAAKAEEEKRAAKAAKKKDANAKPGVFTRIKNWFKDVRSEMQRVVWPTRSELINASMIVIGALVFFGVYIAIIDNVVLIPLNWIATIGS